MIKTLVFTKYSNSGASSRQRTFQFLNLFSHYKFKITLHSLFDDKYVLGLYLNNTRSILRVITYYLKRVSTIQYKNSNELVLIEKELFPYIPFFIERLFLPYNIPFILDFDDAIFHNYDLSKYYFVRLLLGNKIDRLMARAACVICGNEYIAERARLAGARRIEIIPTVVDLERYEYEEPQDKKIITIGWIGSPLTQKYLLELIPVFDRLCIDGKTKIVLIGAHQDILKDFDSTPVEIIPWDEDTEVQSLKTIDIGIMPLPDGPWERGKCGYKLIQYMACGKPVVASPVGVNKQIVEDWKCGLLSKDTEEWETSLRTLINDFELRKELGANGRLAVEKYFSLQSQAPKLIAIFEEVISTFPLNNRKL